MIEVPVQIAVRAPDPDRPELATRCDRCDGEIRFYEECHGVLSQTDWMRVICHACYVVGLR